VSRQLARRRQRERAGGIVLATIGVAVLVVAIIALRKPNGNGAAGGKPTTPKASASTSAPAPAHSTASSSHTTKPPTTKLPLVVLNDTGVSGVGEQAAARFEQGGWQVTSSSDYQNDILSTCAYYDPADPGAQAAAQALQRQFPTIKRVVAKFPELPPGPIVVVLTSDYTAG
jgi:LytR cell envelope-related transcriptional attenuator